MHFDRATITALVFTMGLAFAPLAFAEDAIDWNLTRVNERRLNVNLAGMQIIGAWGAVNVAAGLAMGLRADGESRAFHLMNAGWGAVDLALAGLGYWQATRADPNSFSLAQTVGEQRGIENLFLLNVGLDLAYVAAGAWMYERGKRGDERSAFFSGSGPALMLQGGVLFAFDLLMYLCHRAGDRHVDALVGR
jgi:hypothetical protein